MIEDAVTYLTRRDDWVKQEAIGGGLLVVSGLLNMVASFFLATLLLAFISFFIYPLAILAALPVGGYYIRLFRRTVEGNDVPPEFSNWGELFKEGALALVIGIVYLAIPAFTAFAGVVLFVLWGASLPDFQQPGTTPTETIPELTTGLGAGVIIVFLVAFVLWLVFSYLVTIALINFARRRSFGAAFDFSTIMGVAGSGDFLVGWLIGYFVFGFVAFIIYVVLAFIPFVGPFLLVPLVVPFITFYITVSSNRLFASAFRKAVE